MPLRPSPFNEEFFYREAGYAYDPAKETAEEGRKRCAKELTEAYALGKQVLRFDWNHETHPDRSGVYHRGQLWQLAAYKDGELIDSLGCVDLGADGHPDTEPYARVCEAEMSLANLK